MSAVVKPYSSILTSHSNLEHSDCTLIAINNICDKKKILNIDQYHSIISSINSCVLDRSLNMDLTLVPYPRIHFPLVTYAPIFSTESPSVTTNQMEKSNLTIKGPISDPTDKTLKYQHL